MYRKAGWIAIIYGFALIVLGYVGYVQAQSLTSLRMGGIFGLLMIISSIALFKSKRWGLYSALGYAFILSVVFALRFSLTGKMVPGALALLSIFVFLYLIAKIPKVRKS